MSRLQCHRIDVAQADWEALDAFADRTVFQTREWLRFVSETQNAEPVLAEVRNGGSCVGYFSGLTFSRFRVRVLGSSFPGWTTPYVGFNLLPDVSRTDALQAAEAFAFGELRCLHMEVSDPGLRVEDGEELGFRVGYYASYQTDLRKTEEELLGAMRPDCRRCIRKAEKSGVTVEEAHDEAFADEYYEQLKAVFADQGLVPTYDRDRVRALIRNLEPTGRLLLLRARDAEGKCIATGLFPGWNKTAHFWGNASLRADRILRPNQALHWYAMRYWKRRGMETYDWGGGGSYKESYGCQPYRVAWLSKSRYRCLGILRDEAKRMVERRQRLAGFLAGRQVLRVFGV